MGNPSLFDKFRKWLVEQRKIGNAERSSGNCGMTVYPSHQGNISKGGQKEIIDFVRKKGNKEVKMRELH